jgi:hypothetical protein
LYVANISPSFGLFSFLFTVSFDEFKLLLSLMETILSNFSLWYVLSVSSLMNPFLAWGQKDLFWVIFWNSYSFTFDLKVVEPQEVFLCVNVTKITQIRYFQYK